MDRYALTEKEWNAIKELAHYTPPRGPKPDHNTIRPMLDGICWILGSGAAWRNLPARYGSWSRVYARYRAYLKHGVFEAMHRKLYEMAFENGQLALARVHMDGTYIRAHRHAAGARKKTGSKLRRNREPNRPSDALEEDSAPSSM